MSEAKDSVRWQKLEVLSPSRKSWKHLSEKKLWTTQVCSISSLCQGSPNNFFEHQNHSFRATITSRDQWWRLNPQIQVGSVSFLSYRPEMPSQRTKPSSPADSQLCLSRQSPVRLRAASSSMYCMALAYCGDRTYITQTFFSPVSGLRSLSQRWHSVPVFIQLCPYTQSK